jgi:surface polysaccharide O-acyltransferase-like enzyme
VASGRARAGRAEGLDALKGVAVFAVVAIHALSTGVADLRARPVVVAGGLLTWSVPAFMALAAAFAAREVPGRALVRRLRRLLPHYLAWSVAYVALARVLGGGAWTRLRHTGPASVVLFGGAWYHLYFLPALVQVLLLLPVLRWVAARPARLWPFLVAAGGLLAAGPFTTTGSALAAILASRYAPVWLPAAAAGIGVDRGVLRPRRPGWWVAAGLALLAVESLVAAGRGAPASVAYARTSLPVVVVGAVAAARRWERPPSGLVALGRRSLGVYLLHPALLEVAARAWHLRPYPAWAAAPVALATTLAAAAITAAAWHVGRRRARAVALG